MHNAPMYDPWPMAMYAVELGVRGWVEGKWQIIKKIKLSKIFFDPNLILANSAMKKYNQKK